MITDAIIKTWTDFVGGLLSLIPGWNFGVDASGGGIDGIIRPVAQYAADLSGWIPWNTAAICFAVVAPIYFSSLLFRALRAIFTAA